MPKGKRGTRGKKRKPPDPLQVEVFIKVRQPRIRGKLVEISNAVLQQAMAEWLNTGELPPGIEVSEMRWRNPNRRKPALRNWRSSKDANQTLEEARTTLNIGNWLGARMWQHGVDIKLRRVVSKSKTKKGKR